MGCVCTATIKVHAGSFWGLATPKIGYTYSRLQLLTAPARPSYYNLLVFEKKTIGKLKRPRANVWRVILISHCRYSDFV